MKEKRRKKLIGALALIVIALPMLAGGYVAFNDVDYDYRYTVKAEAVNENEMPTNSTNYDSLTDQEKEMLFRAFKERDGFLEGSAVVVEYEEPVQGLDTQSLRVVRVDGVPILLGIYGPDRVEDVTALSFLGVMLTILGGFLALLGLIRTLFQLDKWRDERNST